MRTERQAIVQHVFHLCFNGFFGGDMLSVQKARWVTLSRLSSTATMSEILCYTEPVKQFEVLVLWC